MSKQVKQEHFTEMEIIWRVLSRVGVRGERERRYRV